MTTLSRRGFLRGMAGAGALGVTGCSPLIDRITQPDSPRSLTMTQGKGRNATAHLLNRAAYGPRPGQVALVEQIGRAVWLEQQLAYEDLPDPAVDLRLRRYDTLSLKSVDMHSFGWDKQYIAGELSAMTLTRAVYSERQLYEKMVEFWSDHFNIYAFKDAVIFRKTVDDRDVIRRHALGNFGDLLRASAHSAAMLAYLDNTLNFKGHPNENYAREIMELHTLGVNGGYTEQDVKEVARCFTGWTVNHRDDFVFRADWHDDGPKTVLGHLIPAGAETAHETYGQSDGERVLDILINHPSTPRYLCMKLVRHFVADDPPADIVNACSQTWQATHGDIRKVMRTLLTHPDFVNAPPKFKRPFTLAVSLLRATNARYDGSLGFIEVLDRLGQRPFAWPRPDGYPDTAAEWQGSLVERWNFCSDALAGKLPGLYIDVDNLIPDRTSETYVRTLLQYFGHLFLNRDFEPSEAAALLKYALPANGRAFDPTSENGRSVLLNTLVLLFCGPTFQWQ